MIGLLGGTFDPIHYGHLRIALEVREALSLDEIRFIPCRQPPHRGDPAATPAQRLAMLRQAVAGTPGFAVDSRELERPGPSYMVDTLTSLRTECGAAPLCLILGRDAFFGLPGWHRWRALLDYAHLLVVQRPPLDGVHGHGELDAWATAHECLPEQLHGRPAGGLCFLPTPLLDISATRIRQLLQTGHDPRYLLPDAVLEYIRQNGLYLT